MDGMETPFVWSLSLYKFFWEHGYLFFSSFFFMDLHVPTFFFFFFNTWTFMCPYFFSIALLSFFNNNQRERDQHILWSIYCVEWMGGTMLSFDRSIARGYVVCMWILIMKAWQKFLSRVTTIWQSSMQDNQHMCISFFKINHQMALVGLWHIKEELCKGFSKFPNKFPKHLNIKSEGHIIRIISQT